MISVSDHALLRYLERVRGFSFEREREEIRRICARADTTGNATVKHNGHSYELCDGRVLTVQPASGHPTRTKARRITGDEP